ncbi:MAG: beta-lactamase family protein [Treponema sp.]|nr:beta-lactamase family protein [Treponema sp.]
MMRKKILPALIPLLIIWITPFASALDYTPSGIPISELERFVDEYASIYIGTKTAGAAIAILKDGELVLNKVYGYAIQDETRITADSVFEWGSATKLLVWTSVMQLAEQGRIDLNSDIRGYLPDNFLKKLKFEKPVTMYNLMNHNAGWEDRVVDLFYASAETVPALKDSLLSYEPLQVYMPGTITAYSNYGTALAGYIVELVSGQFFHEYVWKNIFEPLGMKDTAIHPLQADNPLVGERRRQIRGHINANGKPVPAAYERIFIGLYPAGSAIGTAQDAVKFLAALMPSAEDESGILFKDNKTLNKMLSSSYSFIEGFPGIAHGFIENFYAVKTFGHGGNTAAFSSLFTFSPEERFAAVVLANQASETAMCYMLTKELFGEHEPSVKTGNFADARKFAGLYSMARKPFTGFARLPMSLSVFPVKAIDENTMDLGGAVFVQVSPYVFKNTGGFEFLDIINLAAVETKDDKVSRISIVLFDLLPTSAGSLIITFGSAILFAGCVLFILAAVIISITGAVRNKKKGVPSNLLKKLNIVLYSSMAAVIINNLVLAARAFSFSTYASLSIHFIINIAYMIFTPLCIGFMAANWKKEPAKASWVFNIFSMSLSLILAVIILAWEFWR